MRCLNCGKARAVLSTYKNSTPSDEDDIEGASGLQEEIDYNINIPAVEFGIYILNLKIVYGTMGLTVTTSTK